ncbi:hypothetical protein GALMADRAFT_228479 [Galerina marginata CBS 339.88]|uniref:Uncharacterized protein n=1 Tax=Galerina marginata (strain CBS 339.88) TaxID=685588 RepID=A0A067T184_GALM3|nr:hypothetical protein GALMADRAFT_228479 [Galerina marginata CBS 339.88]
MSFNDAEASLSLASLRTHYSHGISPDPPELLYRSDLESNSFPIPRFEARCSALPVKTAEGVFGTSFNPVWQKVAPSIVALLKQRRVRYSALKSARFSTYDEDEKKTLGQIVVWIATHPTTTSAENEHQVKGAVIEWYEGFVEKLSGPALMRVAHKSNPTYHVRRALTAALGMPISTREREGDRDGDLSARVLAVSNEHALRADTTVDYQALVAKSVAEAVRLTEEIARLEAKPKSDDPEQTEEDEEALEANRNELKKVNKDNVKLQAFFKEISIDVDERHYTRDIGTFELDPQKFKDTFQGNVVDLGAFCLEIKYSSHELDTMSWRNNSNPIQDVVAYEHLASPDCYDENGDPDGSSTDFTVGRYTGLGAYLCDEFGKESIEVALKGHYEHADFDCTTFFPT